MNWDYFNTESPYLTTEEAEISRKYDINRI